MSGDIVVFAGPSLRAADRALLDATYLPPAQLSSIHDAVAAGARAVGLIDGLFERVPAVFHKEILWAMSRGAPVYGAASMGALRAAELADVGMRGVGTVFELFRDGMIEDDDEVAVMHAPAESDYRCASVAMVDIRLVLEDAERAGIIGANDRARVLAIAKSLFYPDRDYDHILDLAEAQLPDVVPALRSWLVSHTWSQKELDAAALLRTMADDATSGRLRAPVVTFEPNYFWNQLHASSSAHDAAATR